MEDQFEHIDFGVMCCKCCEWLKNCARSMIIMISGSRSWDDKIHLVSKMDRNQFDWRWCQPRWKCQKDCEMGTKAFPVPPDFFNEMNFPNTTQSLGLSHGSFTGIYISFSFIYSIYIYISMCMNTPWMGYPKWIHSKCQETHLFGEFVRESPC